VIGTHALLQEKVQFADLGLVVVDEQHRFGVEQRDALRDKGRTAPHLLVMTATPIPRTVAMTVFGDLETSTLAELPPGRSPITTHVVPLAEQPRWIGRTWQRVREEVERGHQVYVVCSRIGDGESKGDSEDTGDPADPGDTGRIDVPFGPEAERDGVGRAKQVPLTSAVGLMGELAANPALSGVRIGLLHGRLPVEERERAMRSFAAGEIDVLVATTVIEVGVDVPNATCMVVMDADRFGVSQLHQLRGRVGRGEAPGLCLLVTTADSESPARERVEAVAKTLDGFELARVDLDQRREGDVLGAAQSGRTSLRLLRVIEHEDVIESARHDATELIAADPGLAGHPALAHAMAQLVESEREAFLERG
jgi:ATP-dependent DNA helicase RecG